MLDDKRLAEIEGKAKKCAGNKLPALALIFSTERELALDAVPQMAAEIRRAWAENAGLRTEFDRVSRMTQSEFMAWRDMVDRAREVCAQNGGQNDE